MDGHKPWHVLAQLCLVPPPWWGHGPCRLARVPSSKPRDVKFYKWMSVKIVRLYKCKSGTYMKVQTPCQCLNQNAKSVSKHYKVENGLHLLFPISIPRHTRSLWLWSAPSVNAGEWGPDSHISVLSHNTCEGCLHCKALAFLTLQLHYIHGTCGCEKLGLGHPAFALHTWCMRVWEIGS